MMNGCVSERMDRRAWLADGSRTNVCVEIDEGWVDKH